MLNYNSEESNNKNLNLENLFPKKNDSFFNSQKNFSYDSKPMSFLPDLEEHVRKFVPNIKSKNNFKKVRKQGNAYFLNKINHDYGNFLVAIYEFTQGKSAEAIKRLQYILKTDKEFVGAVHLLIKIFTTLKELKRTMEVLKLGIKRFPNDAHLKNLYGKFLISVDGNKDEAVKYLEDALKDDPHNVSYWVDTGFSYYMLRNLPMAELCLTTALKINQTDDQVISFAGVILCEHNKLNEAIELFTNALKLYPQNKQIIKNLALYHLKNGDIEMGFRFWYATKDEDRVAAQSVNAVTRRIPWLFKTDLKATTKKLKILVYFEQGIGDYLQFARYLPYLKKLGHSVTAFGSKSVIDFVQQSNDLKDIKFTSEIKLVDKEKITEFDYQTYTFNLPYLLDFKNKIPPSYKLNTKKIIDNNTKLLNKINGLIKPKCKTVAFSYKGRKQHVYDRSRSIDLKIFSKLFSNTNYQFFLVDKNIGEKDEIFLDKFKNVINCDSYLNNWNDTVTVISQLDEIITVDTSLGHLGGVMNHPTSILVHKNCDWRWGKSGDAEKTDWYKSVKIIRQSQSDNWEEVIQKLYSNF